MTGEMLDEKAIFNVARGINSPAARAEYLHQACGGDTDLIERLETLLRGYEEQASFLELPAVGIDLERTSQFEGSIAEQPGTQIGPYKLLEQIGEGGFGVVYMAEQQQPIRRKVALKVIKPGVDTRQVIARFEAERQALALMDHENIAKVLDAGATESGRPYFVMELVHGVPITEFCDQNEMTPRERLELFVSVCRAVQHAHTKGIIHRDIKPSNVLVTLHDGVAVPKVIDFGVAKATGQQLTEKTLFTNFAQMVGTPLYMSPEQAEMTGIDVDTRSDVYSLGVLLYELLTGTTPLDKERLKRSAFDEVRRIIREEEPPRPSLRLSTLGEQATTICAQRKSDPAQLRRLVRGELDWIVMKALDKERSRRYETANAFARDIERYLHDDPVEACPPSAVYRLRKFARRNKVPVLAAAVVLLTLVGGIVGTSVGLIWATRAEALARTRLANERDAREQADAARKEAIAGRQTAQVEAAKATAVSNLLQEMLTAAHPDSASGREYTVRDLLDRFSAGLGAQLTDQPEVEATLRQIIGSVYTRLKLVDEAEPHLRRALELRRQIFGEQHVTYADSLRELAWNILEKSRTSSEVESLARTALTIYRKQNDPDGEIRALWLLVLSADAQLNLDEAEAAAEEILRLAREQNFEGHPDIPSLLHHLAWLKCQLGAPAAAEPLARESVKRHMQVHGEAHPETAFGWQNLGIALRAQGKYDEAADSFRTALQTFRQQFPEDHHFVRSSWITIIDTLRLQENVSALEELKARSPEALQASIAQALWMLRLEMAQRKESDGLQRQAEELVGEMGRYFRRIRCSSSDNDSSKVLVGMPQPLFVYHYSKILAGSLWGWGDSGRPVALVAVELCPVDRGLTLRYELTSLSSHSLDFEAPNSDGTWRVQLRGITFQELPHATAPEQSADARLRQMQAIVQRMTSWLAGTSPVALHALPNPIYRYSTSGEGVTDGAVFLFCDEANPEFVLILEAHEPNTWRFGVARLSALPRITLYFDGQLIWTSMPTPDSYTITDQPITRRNASRFSAIYTAAVSREPNSASAHRGLGYSLDAEGRWSEALASHQEALRIEPYDASRCNSVAWRLATDADESLRDIAGALVLANQAVELAPADGNIWNTLGAAQYRAGQYQSAIESLQNSMKLRSGGNSEDWFFLAMAEWQLGNQDTARSWFDKAVAWMEEHAPRNSELIRFRAEAAELLGIAEPQSPPNPQPPDNKPPMTENAEPSISDT